MKRSKAGFLSSIYRGHWIQKFVAVFRRKLVKFLKEETKEGSLSYGFKASVYAATLNEKLSSVLSNVPSDVPHRHYAPFYTEKLIIEAIENDRSLEKAIVDLAELESHLELAKRNKKNTPNKVSSILFVTSMFPSLDHGGGLKVFDTIQELVALGYKVSLYSMFHQSVDEKSCQELLPSLTQVRLVNPEFFNLDDFTGWLNEKNLNFDLAHYVWPHASLLIPKDHARIKCHVFDFIETTARRCIMGIEVMLQNKEFKHLGKMMFELIECFSLEARACALADKFICTTDKDSEFSRDLYKIPAPYVVQIGVSRHAILQPLKDEHFINIKSKPMSAGFIGNYNHYPNVDGVEWYLDNVHAKILAKVPDYTFRVIGFGLPSTLIEKYKDHPSIIFVGAVDSVIEALKPLSVCVAPLISGAGFRVKLNQFSILAKPTVSTTIGACGMPYVNGKSIFITDDPEEFADDVANLLQDSRLNTDVGQRAYEVVEKNYFWEPHIKKLVHAYEN